MNNQDSGRLWKKISCQTFNKPNTLNPSVKQDKKAKKKQICRGQQKRGTRPSSNQEQISFSELEISKICYERKNHKQPNVLNKSQSLCFLLEELHDPENIIQCQSEVSLADKSSGQAMPNDSKYREAIKIFKNIITCFGEQFHFFKSSVKLQLTKMNKMNKQSCQSLFSAYSDKQLQYSQLEKNYLRLQTQKQQIEECLQQKKQEIQRSTKLIENFQNIISDHQKLNCQLKEKITEIERKTALKNEELEKNIRSLLQEHEKKEKSHSYKNLASYQSQIEDSIRKPTYRVQCLRESIEEFKNSMAQKNRLKVKDENYFYKNQQQISISPCRENYHTNQRVKKGSQLKNPKFHNDEKRLQRIDMPTRNSFAGFSNLATGRNCQQKQKIRKFATIKLGEEGMSEKKLARQQYFQDVKVDKKQQEIMNLGTRLRKMKLNIQEEIKMMKNAENA